MYSSSVKPLPVPAPFCTSTSWPSEERSRAPEGVMPTRYSLFLISVGTPIRIGVSLLAGAYCIRERQKKGGLTARPFFFYGLTDLRRELGGVVSGNPNADGARRLAAASASTMPHDVRKSH